MTDIPQVPRGISVVARPVEARLSRKTFEGNEPGRRTRANGNESARFVSRPGRASAEFKFRADAAAFGREPYACDDLVFILSLRSSTKLSIHSSLSLGTSWNGTFSHSLFSFYLFTSCMGIILFLEFKKNKK